MYLNKRKKPNGRIYLTIAESYRENGKNKTRHVEAIGYVDELATPERPDPIAWWDEEIARRNEAAREAASPVIVKL